MISRSWSNGNVRGPQRSREMSEQNFGKRQIEKMERTQIRCKSKSGRLKRATPTHSWVPLAKPCIPNTSTRMLDAIEDHRFLAGYYIHRETGWAHNGQVAVILVAGIVFVIENKP